MKTILVCTDFSPAARNASFYAAQLARALNARMVMVNAFQPESVVLTEIPVIIGSERIHEIADKELKHEVARLQPAPGLQMITHSQEGFPIDVILNAADEFEADIIVAGSKATGKNIRRVFGSTVTGLARRTKRPLIVVPEHISFVNPSHIALAWESDASLETDPHLLDAIKEIADRFDSSVYLVHVSKNVYKEAFAVLNRPFRLQRLLYSLAPEVKNIHGKDLGNALNEFIKDNNVDMLAMLPHKHSLLERFFMASATRELVFESSIPVLVLPGTMEH